MRHGPVLEAYDAAIAAGTHEPDPAQQAAAARLDELHARLVTPAGAPLWSRMLRMLSFRRREPVRGLYLWGGVGRGKTWLMDLFHQRLETPRKRRVHFHRFMREVHRALTDLGETRDPLQRIASDIASELDVLCFDEVVVSDIGDAMILGNLFQALFDRGVTLVATSNTPPDGLYQDGLQRARFLPAIAALERHTEVFEVVAGTDFRLRALKRAALYHCPDGAVADQRMSDDFRRIAGDAGNANATLDIDGRPLSARRCADGVAWFDFDALCDGPRAAADYIELARTFHTVLVSGVPRMDATLDDQARRFITMVDEFYDRRVKLVLTAAVPMDELYTGNRLRFEFQRTQSRLAEMQSHEYLAEPHLG
jgi:cell division protein ZapE